MPKSKSNVNQEVSKTKMKKYIVETLEPKTGQNASSGGIRENGKMVSQFRNPIPYEESSSLVSTSSYNIKDMFKDELKEIGYECAIECWNEFGAPLLKKAFRILRKKAISALDSSINSQIRQTSASLPDPKSIDMDTVDILSYHDENEKIISFPSRHIG